MARGILFKGNILFPAMDPGELPAFLQLNGRYFEQLVKGIYLYIQMIEITLQSWNAVRPL